MATLCLGNVDCAAPLLRDWLASDWGIVFSHPMDFQDSGTEQDRWLAILRDEFRARTVRPIACSRPSGDADNSWVSQLTQDRRLVRCHAATHGSEDIIDMAARELRDEIAKLDSHFALIVDPSLKSRGVLRYSAGRTSVSPLDLLGSIDALRQRVPARAIGRSRGEVRAVA
jgi:alkyl hydroperoxide reductase subunit AhpC